MCILLFSFTVARGEKNRKLCIIINNFVCVLSGFRSCGSRVCVSYAACISIFPRPVSTKAQLEKMYWALKRCQTLNCIFIASL